MGLDIVSYSTATQAIATAEQSLSNARQWKKNSTYMIGDVCIFNNSFYVCAYSHDSGDRFEYDAWTKINNSADKLKGVNINITDKINGKVMTYNKETDSIELKNIPTYIDDNNNDAIDKTYSVNKINLLLDNKINMSALGIAHGIVPLDENTKIPMKYLPTSKNGNSTYVVRTSVDKDNIKAMQVGDRVIVLNDEHNNRVGYIFDGVEWLKDTDTDWENINIHWDNIINKPNIPSKTSDLIKDDIYTQDQINSIIGNNVLETEDKTIKGAINEVYNKAFQYGVNVKENVVTALTSKNQDVTTQNSWEDIVKAIDNIHGDNSDKIVKQITRLNVNASQSSPYIYDIKLNNKIQDANFICSVREFIKGQDKTTLITSFDNADTNYFKPNNSVNFDGDLYIKEQKDDIISTHQENLRNGKEYIYDINLNNYAIITSIEDNDNHITVGYKVLETIVVNNNDIDLSHLDSLNKVIFNSTTMYGGQVLVALSIDGGKTFKGYNVGNKIWEDIDIQNKSDFKTKGMSKTIVDSLSNRELEQLRNSSDKIRFAYYISIIDDKSIAKCEDISIAVSMMGTYTQANKSDYDISIGLDNVHTRVTFYKNGTYTINYVD
ncbi:carbohydrate binding domain protein [Clostridium botulinum C str. Eklund]|nr:carbohydrate binding domain protein [Clostridium botulinum C str. Eklund]